MMLNIHSSGANCTLEQLHNEGPGTGVAHEGSAFCPGMFTGQKEL